MELYYFGVICFRFMQPPSNIQKGQRGAKPHNKNLTSRSSPESVPCPDVVQKCENSPTAYNDHNDGVKHVMDFAKSIYFNGTVIKSEPNDSTTSVQENTFRNTDSHSPTTTTRSEPSSPKRLKSSPILTLPISEQKCNNNTTYPYNMYTMGSVEREVRLEPKQAHVKTEAYHIPRVPSNQLTDSSNCSAFHEEPQDFTMTTLKRKHRESIEYDNVETKFNQHNEDETQVNSNYSFTMS